MNSDKVVVAVSGGFDPVHIGHVRMLNEAKALGDYLIVIVNNDNWLRTKKGSEFMPQDERKEILENFRAVDEVVFTKHKVDDPDRSVMRSLREIKPDIFANGGDRKDDNIPEYIFCQENNIAMEFNVGHGGKIQSSSWLIENANQEDKK